MARVAFDEVTKVYPGPVVAVDDLTLDVADGEFLILVGPSGCGKSTALRMVAGLERISDGTISIGDRVVNDVPPKDRDIAMVFQNYALYPHMTVEKNLGFGLRRRQTPREDVRQRVDEISEMLGLDGSAPPSPRAALGRPAPARGDGPGARSRARGVPAGRAALEPGRQAPRPDAVRAQAAARAHRRHDDLRDPRPGRGDHARRADRRALRGRPAAGRPAAGRVRPPRERLRRRVHRLAADEPVEGERRAAGASRSARSSSWTGRSPTARSSWAIRPEGLRPVGEAFDGPVFEVCVEVVEPLGDEVLVHGSVAAPAASRNDARPRRGPGSPTAESGPRERSRPPPARGTPGSRARACGWARAERRSDSSTPRTVWPSNPRRERRTADDRGALRRVSRRSSA